MGFDWTTAGEIVKAIGALAGFAAFAVTIFNTRRAYIQQKITIRDVKNDTFLLIDLEVQNTSPWPKRIDHAFLIVSPYEEEIVSGRKTDKDTGEVVKSTGWHIVNSFKRQKRFERLQNPVVTNDLELLPKSDKIEENSRAYIPLMYFFSENVRISDETLRYTVALKKSNYFPGQAYAVRFYIAGSNRLHRSVHSAFSIQIAEFKDQK